MIFRCFSVALHLNLTHFGQFRYLSILPHLKLTYFGQFLVFVYSVIRQAGNFSSTWPILDNFRCLSIMPYLKLVHFGQFPVFVDSVINQTGDFSTFPMFVGINTSIWWFRPIFCVCRKYHTSSWPSLASGVAISTNTRNSPKWVSLRFDTIDKHRKLTKLG